MQTTHTYCDFHLGDNLFHLHFLRHLALKHPDRRFIHAAHGCHLAQLAEVVEDLGNVGLTLLEDRPPEALNSWKNAGGFFQDWPDNWRYYEFYLDWFAHHAKQMGLESPFTQMTDLLFDYPALTNPMTLKGLSPGIEHPEFDILFVNSQPCSGQWLAYDDMEQRHGMNVLAAELVREHCAIVTQRIEIGGQEIAPQHCTRNFDLSVTGIGNLSRRCQLVLMIGTGPAWPTCNVHNVETARIVLLQPERVNYDPRIRHARTLNETRAMLAEMGWL